MCTTYLLFMSVNNEPTNKQLEMQTTPHCHLGTYQFLIGSNFIKVRTERLKISEKTIMFLEIDFLRYIIFDDKNKLCSVQV